MSKCNAPDQPDVSTRRHLLRAAVGGLAGLALAPGVRLVSVANAAETAGASASVRWGLLIDTNKCAKGCTACVDACQSENHLSNDTGPQASQWIRKVELKDMRTGHEKSMPVMCQHCANPPCVDVCPTTASFKRPDGIVLVDRHRCIGCRFCVMACPYKARNFVHEPLDNQNPDVPRGVGTAEGCSLCVHRIDKGQQPACVEACAAKAQGAMVFGDLNDPNSEISQQVARYDSRALRADLQLDPGVRYL